AEINHCVTVPGFDPAAAKETLNRWIAHETGKAVREITEAIEAYKFNEAAGAAYRFVWNVFCDWYLELAKPVLQGADGAAKDETRAVTAFVFDQICKLLHPFMPFLTEELWAIKWAELHLARKAGEVEPADADRVRAGADLLSPPLRGRVGEGGRDEKAGEAGAPSSIHAPGGPTPTPDPSPQGGG